MKKRQIDVQRSTGGGDQPVKVGIVGGMNRETVLCTVAKSAQVGSGGKAVVGLEAVPAYPRTINDQVVVGVRRAAETKRVNVVRLAAHNRYANMLTVAGAS